MTFEELLARSRALRVAPQATQRRVEWLGAGRMIGFALQPEGGMEIFLCGDPLSTRSPLVRRHLQYDHWQGSDTTFTATRIMLPADAHFRPVAAFIAEELFRNGFEASPSQAFAAAEPIIEIALRRLAASDEIILGLIGEIRFLNILLSQTSTAAAMAAVMESWGGHRRQSRDFTARRVAVEVKTTIRAGSEHHVSSLAQVDPRRDSSGVPLETLFLLSIGLVPPSDPDDPAATISLPRSVDESLAQLGPNTSPTQRNGLQTLLLERLRAYGGSEYEHDSMRSWPAYSARYSLAFMRLYDLQDPNVHVLRRADALAHDAVQVDSISYDVHLPERITGDLNPQLDVIAFARRFLAELGGRL